MNYGLVIYDSLETVSGGYLYDRKLVEHLRQQGEQVEIISLPWRNYGRHLLDNFSADLYQRLKEGKYDVLLQDELNHPSLFWLNGRLRPRPYPIISIIHHLRCSERRPSWQNQLYRWVERRYLRSVDGFIFNSATTQQAVEQLAGGGRPSVVAHPAGDRFGQQMTEAAVRQRANQPGPLRLLFVGNLIPRKGLEVVLRAVALLPADSWRLDVVGSLAADDAYTTYIQRLIQQFAFGNQVVLHGLLDDQALGKLLQTSHLLVVPSSYEGFGIVYLEGMGFGLPAIATTAGAASEIISDGRNGFLIAEGAAQTLAQRLALLSDDRQRLAQMGTAALQRYQTHPTWEQSMVNIHRFLSNPVWQTGYK